MLISVLLYPLAFPAWECLCVWPVCLTLILQNLSPFRSQPSELKSMLAKMLMLLTRIPICCLEDLWLIYCNKGGVCCCKYILRAKRKNYSNAWNSASTIKTAAAILNITGLQSTEYSATFLRPGTWVPSNALRHKMTNVCPVVCIFSLTPTPTHTCTDCVT